MQEESYQTFDLYATTPKAPKIISAGLALIFSRLIEAEALIFSEMLRGVWQ